jgi:hypothetical protein
VRDLAISLITDDDFEFAMRNQSAVTVWQNKMLLGYGEKIVKYDSVMVHIDGECYVRSVCDFKLT